MPLKSSDFRCLDAFAALCLSGNGRVSDKYGLNRITISFTHVIRIYIFWLLAIPVVELRGQTVSRDTAVYSVRASSTGSFSKTNDLKSFIFNNVLKLGVTKGKFAFQNSSGWIYGEQSGVKINNDFSSVLEGDWSKKVNKFYFWGIGTFDKSYSLKIDYRYQVGAGPGYTIVRNPKVTVVISDGIMFEQGDLADPELGQTSYSTWRNSFRLKYHWLISDIVSFDGTGFIQPSLSHKHDNILRYTTTLSVKLRKWLSLTSSLTYNRLTRTDRENLVVTYGIAVTHN